MAFVDAGWDEGIKKVSTTMYGITRSYVESI